MVVRMRVTRSHTGNRRSHHKVEGPRLAKCECGAFHQKHRVCHECGKYRGRQVVDVVARKEREQQRSKRREEALRDAGMESAENTPAKEEEKDTNTRS